MSRNFTPAEDRIIIAGRTAGLSWNAIGAQLGACGKTCQYRVARSLGMPDPKLVHQERSKIERDPWEGRQRRDALPAGADASWRAITAGTVLDGSGYR